MPSRPGSESAASFFNECEDVEVWSMILLRYDEALNIVSSTKKNPKNLVELDKYWRVEYPALVLARSIPHFNLVELSKVMAWKLMRGKMRPLQKLCDSNCPDLVVTASTKALNFLTMKKPDWKNAIIALTSLKAVGEATASALLAPLFPAFCPFMSDEVLEITFGSRVYNLKSYTTVQSELAKKAKFLGGSWNAENVGKTMWIVAILSASGVNVWTPLLSNSVKVIEEFESNSQETGYVHVKLTEEEEGYVPTKKQKIADEKSVTTSKRRKK